MDAHLLIEAIQGLSKEAATKLVEEALENARELGRAEGTLVTKLPQLKDALGISLDGLTRGHASN